ncbi:MAG: hypothetical protein JNM81_13065 [Rhodospirillaceae bacterium]|nr:hypothetical protein [Rhodospirillaceae bacterium]
MFLFLWRLKDQSEDEARAVAERHIGQHARIQTCLISEQIDFPKKDYESRMYAGANVFNIQSMYYAVKMADQIRTEYEQKNGFKYDCVIRARGDSACFRSIDLKKYKPLLPHYLLLPEVQYFQPGFNDTFAFSSSDNMRIYSGLYDKLDEYFYRDKIQFNPHIMLFYHTVKSGLPFAYLSIPVEFVRELPLPQVFEG